MYHLHGNAPTKSDSPVWPVFEQPMHFTSMMRTENSNGAFVDDPVTDDAEWGYLLLLHPKIILSPSSLIKYKTFPLY